MTIKIKLPDEVMTAAINAYVDYNFRAAITAALEAMVEEGMAVEGYADNLGLVRVLTIRLSSDEGVGEEAMTSRADSLTFEDLQKAKESGMADIVEKLRNIDNISGDIEESEIERVSTICDEAAAEIERLTAALAEARDVMKPFNGMTYKHQLDSAQVYITSFDQDGEEWAHGSCRVGDLRRLVQWLERNP